MTPALVKGRLYDFPQLGYPAMTVGDDWVKGCLIRFQQELETQTKILRRLDWLEGYKADRLPAENDYQRCWVMIFTTDYKPAEEAWVYVMDADRVRSLHGIYLPSGTWPS